MLTLYGRLLDLKSAYKQLASRPEHAFAAVIATLNEVGEGVFFIARTLLFGETAAVYNCNRISKLIDTIASKLGWLLTTCYYDDFPCVECGPLAASAERTFKEFLAIVGVRVSSDPEKGQALRAGLRTSGRACRSY